MSNFDFMNQKNLIVKYPAFAKMYEYIIAAENYYYVNNQLCGMNVRWTLEQFCCLISDLKGVCYKKNPTYMGEFLSAENKFQLLLAVDGQVNYKTICDVNVISREYAHSIALPDRDMYADMLPKMFALIVWLYKSVLGIDLKLTYSSFTYDKVPKKNVEPTLAKKEDTIHTTNGQIEDIRQLFPNCDMNIAYSINKTDNGLQLLDENGNVVESYLNEDTMIEDAEEKKRLEEEIRGYKKREENIKKQYEEELTRQKQNIRDLKFNLATEQCSNNSKENRIVELTAQIELAGRTKEKLMSEYDRKIFKMQRERDSLQQAYNELLTEKEKAEEMQRKLKENLSIRNVQKNNLEKEVKKLTLEIAEADKKINDMETTFQTKSEAYKLLVKMKNMLLMEKEHLEEVLEQAREEYDKLSVLMQTELDKYKNRQIHLETLLANAQAQTAYYKKIVEELKTKMNEDTMLLVVDNVNCFQQEYLVYQKTQNREAFRNVLLGIRSIIDDVRVEVDEERNQRKQDKKEIDRKINKVEKMVKKNFLTQKLLLLTLLLLCLPLTCFMVILLMENREVQSELKQTASKSEKEKEVEYTSEERNASVVKEIEDNLENETKNMQQKDENESTLTEENTLSEDEVSAFEETINPEQSQSAIPDDTKMEEIIENHIEIPEDFTCIPGINETLLEEIFYITSLDYERFEFHPEEFDVYDRIELWCVDSTDDFFMWTDDDMTVYKYSDNIKFLSYMNQNLMYAVSIEDFVENLDSSSTFEDCKQVFGDNIYVFENAHPTSFSTSQDEDMTMFILKDGSKVLLGWNTEEQICDYVYFYPLVKKYNLNLNRESSKYK